MSGLGQQTGGDANSRYNEAKRLLEIIAAGNCGALNDWELNFLERQRDWVLNQGNPPSGKVLFTLRDIRDKVIA